MRCERASSFLLVWKEHRERLFDLFLLWGGAIGGAGISFLTTLVAARTLGSTEFGVFSSVSSAAVVITPLLGLGVATFWLQEFGKDPASLRLTVRASLRVLVISLVAFLVIVTTCSFLLFSDWRRPLVILVLFGLVLFQLAVELRSSILQVEGRFRILALWQFCPHLLRLGVILALLGVSILTSWKLAAVPLLLIFSMSGLGFVVVSYIGISRYLSDCAPLSDEARLGPRLRYMFSGSWPFAMAAFLAAVYYQGSIALVGMLVGSSAAGNYGLALSILSFVYLLPTVIFQKYLLPRIHVWLHNEGSRLRQVFVYATWGCLIVGLVFWGIVYLVADAIPIVFGAEYVAAVDLLKIVSFGVPFMFSAIGLGAMLATSAHVKRKIVLMCVVALFSVCATIALVDAYGVVGAAYSSVGTGVLLCFLYFAAVRSWVLHSGDSCL